VDGVLLTPLVGEGASRLTVGPAGTGKREAAFTWPPMRPLLEPLVWERSGATVAIYFEGFSATVDVSSRCLSS
jgi:hypothetical protein